VFQRLSRFPKVTLAAINGPAVGGGLELALACDLRIAADTATFSFPEPDLGLIPAAGGTRRLTEAVGRAKAKELILGGRQWSAEEALRFGLVSELCARDDLSCRAQTWAERIARRHPTALLLAKRAIDLDIGGSAGYSFESVAEALLYELRRNDVRLSGTT
jgi:enoyl-CoA hydratase/carnithine racemase